MTGILWCPVSSARSIQNGWKEEEEEEDDDDDDDDDEKMKRGNSDYDAFSSHELQVAFGNTVTRSTLKSLSMACNCSSS